MKIAAYFNVNGIKVSQPKKQEGNKIDWIQIPKDNRVFDEEKIKNLLNKLMIPKEYFEPETEEQRRIRIYEKSTKQLRYLINKIFY